MARGGRSSGRSRSSGRKSSSRKRSSLGRKSPKMTAKRRRGLPKSSFGVPSKRGYPMDTKRRAANAKGRAKQQLKRGRLSKSTYSKIVAKANRKLGKKK